MVAISNCVNLCQHGVCSLNAKFLSSLDDRTSHCNTFANTTFISITSHYWRSPEVPYSSCKTLFGALCYRAPFGGIISDRGGAGVSSNSVLVSRSDKLLLLLLLLLYMVRNRVRNRVRYI